MASDSSLLAFKAISSFVSELSHIFGEKQRPLKLLAHLISKTTLSHTKVIERYALIFREFCVLNRDAILNKDAKLIKQSKIIYSERLYIEIAPILKIADNDTKQTIWRHLLLISAHLDPESNAKQMIKSLVPALGGDKGNSFKVNGDGKEAEFISNLMSKIDGAFSPGETENLNPQNAIMKIMQTGLFTDIMSGLNSGLNDGSLNLQRLLGTVQDMVSNNQREKEGEEGGAQAAPAMNLDPMSLITSIMGSLNKDQMGGGGGANLDFGSIASMIGPLMSNMNAMNSMNTSSSDSCTDSGIDKVE